MVGKIAAVFLILMTFILPSTVSLTDAPPLTQLPEERLSSYLSERQWELLNPDTPMHGSIRGFASDGPERCAIWLENRVYLFYGEKAAACFHIKLSNASRLFFLDNQLGLYEDRGLFVLFIDLDTYDTTLYVMQIENGDSRQWGLSNRFAALVNDPTNGGDGYYVRNKLWIDFLSVRYDSLTRRVDGAETVLYATNRRMICLALFFAANLIALIVLLCKLQKKKRKSGKTPTAQKQRLNCCSIHRNTPHFVEKTVILVLAYAFTAANLIFAGILSAVEGNDSAQYSWLFLLGGVMAFMTPLQILDTRKEMRGTFAAVGAGILHFTFCTILAYLGSLWWLAVYGGQVLLCVFMLTVRRIAHRKLPE